MIKHIVCWKIKDFAEGKAKPENILIMKEMLVSLKYKISLIKELEFGINLPEADTANFDAVLIVLFDSHDNLKAYIRHPEHLKVNEFISKIRETRVCIDYAY